MPSQESLTRAHVEAIRERAIPGLVVFGLLSTVFGCAVLDGWMRYGFFVAVGASIVVRGAFVLRMVRETIPPEVVLRLYRGIALCTYFIWSIPAAVVARHPGDGSTFALITTAGLAAGAATSLATDPPLLRVAVVVLLAPPAITMAISRGVHGVPLALTLALFAVFLLTIGANARKTLVVHLKNLELLEEKNDALEQNSAAMRQARLVALAASKRADTANKAKSAFLAAMSHDLRTPLTAVLGYAELLRDPAISDETRLEHAATIQQSGKHLLALLNQILDTSKIEAGAMVLQKAPFDLPEMLGEIASLMRVRADTRGLRFSVTLSTAIPKVVSTDALRVRQILENLIGNALKFTDRGSVDVVVALDGAKLRFGVVDTGAGMSDAQLARLFGEYVQVDDTSERMLAGTGLGLSLSRKMARLLGGDVTVTSKAGVGSTFAVTIPVDVLGDAPMIHEIHSQRPASTTLEGLSLSGMSVLIGDDTESTRALLRAFLEHVGATVEVARHGREVLERFAQGARPDLVLMDMQMPVMDGLETTRQLRALGHKVPIVALTGRAMATDRELCLAAGFDDWATKPITRATLIALVSRFRPVTPARSASAPETREPIRSSLLDDPVIAAVLDSFYEELDDALVVLETRTEAKALAATAHVLAGAGGSFGFPALTEAAQAVEEGLLAVPDPERMKPAIDELVSVCHQIRSARRPARKTTTAYATPAGGIGG